VVPTTVTRMPYHPHHQHMRGECTAPPVANVSKCLAKMTRTGMASAIVRRTHVAQEQKRRLPKVSGRRRRAAILEVVRGGTKLVHTVSGVVCLETTQPSVSWGRISTFLSGSRYVQPCLAR
jgi:hypothetical protein